MDKFITRFSVPYSSTPNAFETRSIQERSPKKKKVAEDDSDTGEFENLIGQALAWEKSSVDAALYSAEPSSGAIGECNHSSDNKNKELAPTYQTSIYVDAFNLALDTVLEHEAHLFSNGEMSVFSAWRDLDYEAQYLYVRLFLRKKAIWHRVQKLRYQSNISNLGVAMSSLEEQRWFSVCEVSNISKLPSPDNGLNICSLNGQSPFVFLETSEELVTTVNEAGSLLSLDELKAVAKESKLRGKTKAELLAALVDMSTKQTILTFTEAQLCNELQELKSDRDNTKRQAVLHNVASNLEGRLLRRILKIAGPCVRVSSITFRLFERVHLVFYRTCEWTERSLTTIILAKISKRNFAGYVVSRTNNVFESRQQLLEFEKALRLEHEIDEMIASDNPPTADIFKQVVLCFYRISDRWRQGLGGRRKFSGQPQQPQDGGYLNRFCAAHVFTRIAHTAAYALGRLHNHSQEHVLLTELLHQRLFHTARRGSWYQRKALLEEHYMSTAFCGDEKGVLHENRRSWYQRAVATCEQALTDPSCHLIYHHDLRKRLIRLEMRLRIPRRLQHDFGHLQFLAPEKHVFEGTQINPGRGVLGNCSTTRSRKTVWVDESGEGLQCTVETMCLNQYRKQGWKGLHSEGGIVRTLYAYLFFDIIFLYVPDVFQTAYQTSPLDLLTDGFYAARASEINRRLVEIANGEAESIVRSIHISQVGRRPCVMGLNWEFPLEEVAEIARCFNGGALAAVCKVLTEEYRQRAGGVPDLLLWRMEPQPEVMFAEVKSINDRLSDTQRLWIHVLLEAGAKVAVCNAIAKGACRN